MKSYPGHKSNETILESEQPCVAKSSKWTGQFFAGMVFSICFIAAWIWRAVIGESPGLDIIVISAAAIGTLLVINQRLPMQNIVGLVVTMAVFWWATLLIANVSGVFFLPPRFNFHYVREYGFGLFWAVGLINARGIAKLILHRKKKSANQGLWLIALSSLLIAIEDSGARKSLFFFAEKFVFAVVFFVAATPWFIDKKRIAEQPDYQPLLFTTLLMLW